MPYDQYGRTPEMAEQDRKRTRVGLIIGVLVFLFIMFFVGTGMQAEQARIVEVDQLVGKYDNVTFPTMDSLTFTYTNNEHDIIYIYTITDSDTGQQYLVSDHGGITPRLGYSPN